VILAMKEEQETGGRSMISDAGKRESHAHKTGESLAQRVLPALDMGGFSGLAGPPPCAAPPG